MEHFVLLCTGGIGSGKSFVAKVFNAVGVPSYDCDSRARGLYDTDRRLALAVDAAVGGGVMVDGAIDRKRLAEAIFSSRGKREAVEALVHPAVLEDFGRWVACQRSRIVIVESAIMLDKPIFADVPDAVLTVTAPEDVRVSRVISRDSVTAGDVMHRIASQSVESDFALRADYVVVNDGSRAILPQVMEIIRKIEKYGKDKS